MSVPISLGRDLIASESRQLMATAEATFGQKQAMQMAENLASVWQEIVRTKHAQMLLAEAKPTNVVAFPAA